MNEKINNNKYGLLNIILLMSVLAVLIIYLFHISSTGYKKVSVEKTVITESQKQEAVRKAYLTDKQKSTYSTDSRIALSNEKLISVRQARHAGAVDLSQNQPAKIVINRKIVILDFNEKGEDGCDRNVVAGNFVIAKGSPSILKENTTVKGNLYIMNISSNYKLPAGLKVEGHIFVKNAKSVQLNDDLELDGNVYVYDSGLMPVSQTAKIKGQIIL